MGWGKPGNAVIRDLPGYILVFDAGGRLINWNGNLRRLSGLTDRQLKGADPFRFVAKADRARARAAVIDGFSGAESENEFSIHTRAGDDRIFRWAGRTVVEDGAALLVVVGADVSAERRLTEAFRQVAEIVEQSNDAIITASPDLIITSWNGGAERMYGYTAKEAVGRSIDLLVPADERPPLEERLSRLAESPHPVPYQSVRMHKDGHLVPVSNSLARILDLSGKVVGFASNSQDITKLTQVAEDRAYRGRLMRAVALATTELVTTDSIDEAMPKALNLIGKVVRADRLMILRNTGSAERPVELRHVWQPTDPVVRIEPAGFHPFPLKPSTHARWDRQLRAGNPIVRKVKTSRGAMRAALNAAGIKSMLALPIFAHRKYWGSFVVDDCKTGRTWSSAEVHSLTMLADVVGAVTANEKSARLLGASEEQFRVLTETATDAIAISDSKGEVLFWNSGAERLFGYSASEVAGRRVYEMISPIGERAAARQTLVEFASSKSELLGKTTELNALRKDGSEVAIELSLGGVEIQGAWRAIAIARNITERKRIESRMADMARTDPLTGLPNRRAFIDSLEQSMATAQRTGDAVAVLYLDLDHFKDINDTLSHPIGDALLKAVADRLRKVVRRGDPLARFGGDEFAIIAVGLHELVDAAAVAQVVLTALSKPFSVGSSVIRTGASIGIAFHQRGDETGEALMTQADIALYRSKNDGRGVYRFFTKAMDAEVRQRVTLSDDLRVAFDGGQLFLLYQPQIDVLTNHVIGFEALVRWRHPKLGVIGPDQFIPTAERMGLIAELGRWVLRSACRQMRDWLTAGLEPGVMAVNVSPLQFKMPLELERDVSAILAETGVDPKRLELELTESALMQVSSEHNDVLIHLRENGVRLAIDDFGTGYSSLIYLRRFPVDRLKIAQNFVLGIQKESSDAAIVQATIALAKALHIETIAEGAESAAQVDLLASWGCTNIQGFYFARPLTAKAAEDFMRAGPEVHVIPCRVDDHRPQFSWVRRPRSQAAPAH
jgi:diguanylate cyclase (GGDEF)-like protein/PAS domain S-box-containing protein